MPLITLAELSWLDLPQQEIINNQEFKQAVAELREIDKQRQREGIAIAVKEGKYKGGQVKKIDDDTFNKYYQQYKNREINKVQFAKALNISRPTLDKLLKGTVK